MRFAFVLLLASGCAIGAGTSTVGIWRPKRVVDTEVCVQERGTTGCSRTTEVARDMPARSFGGGLVAWFNPGYMHLGGDAGSRDLFVADSHYEYLRGRGGFALGGRLGANIAFGADKQMMFTMPVTAVGHWGFERFSLYGGAGYTPYALYKVEDASTTLHGFHVMAGARYVVQPRRSTRLTSSVDVFQYFLEGVVATSATTAIGLHF